MSIYNTLAIREEIAELHAEGEALNAMATAEERSLTADEKTRFDEILAAIGDDNDTPTGLYASLKQAEKFEAIKANVGSPKPTARQPGSMSGTREPEGNQPTRIVPVNRFGRLQAFKGEDAQLHAYGTGRWLKANMFGDEESREWCNSNAGGIFATTHTEGTDASGGYLVPDPLAATIIDVVERFAVMRPLCRVIPMTADTLKVNKRLTGLTVDYPGEATATTESNKTWGQVALAAVLRTVLTKFSKELRDDALIAVVDDLTMEIGRAFGNQEDNEIVNGDGTSTYGSEEGILDQLNANAKNVMGSGDVTYGAIALADLTATTALLPEKYHPMASWLMRRGTWQGNVQPIIYAGGGVTMQDFGNGPRPSLLGYPVEFTDQMPTEAVSTAAALFGSFRDGVIVGDRGNYSVMASEHRYFEEMSIGLIAGRRYDVKVHSIGTAASDRAIVGLYTAAS